MKNNLVSIIVVNLNGKKLLRGWYKSIKMQTYTNYEVIFVDNGSDDGSCELTKRICPQAKIIKNKTNLGFPKACNQAVKLAKGKYYFFLNNDLKLAKNCLQKLVAFMDSSKKVVMAGPVSYQGDKKDIESAGFSPNLTGFFLYTNKVVSPKPYEVFGISVAMIIRAGSYKKLGGFDSDFFLYSEEVDMCLRIRTVLGGEIWIVPGAQLYHLGGHTSKKMPKDFIIFHGTKSRLFMIIKNFSLPFLLIMLPLHLLLLLIKLISFMVLGKLDQAKAVIKGIVWIINNFNLIYQKRKLVQNQKIVSDWVIFKRFFKILPAKRAINTTLNYLKSS